MSKDESSKKDRLSPTESGKKTTNDIDKKITYLEDQLIGRKLDPLFGLPESIREVAGKRMDDPFHGLPRNVSKFCSIKELPDTEENLDYIPRSTLTGRKELLKKVEKLVSDIKDANVHGEGAQVAEIRKERDELDRQLATLGAENHSLHLELEEMRRDFKSQEVELKRLRKLVLAKAKSQKVTDSNVTSIR